PLRTLDDGICCCLIAACQELSVPQYHDRMAPPPAHSRLSLWAVTVFAAELPLPAELLGLCGGGAEAPWRVARPVDGDGANLSLPPLRTRRMGSGAGRIAARRGLV